jgi:GNAT superfamily N-acetyltransferase
MFAIRPATETDVPTIRQLIRELAEYERLTHEAVVTESALRETLFAPRPCAEVLIAEARGEVAGFALFFHNYSTFVGKPGLYVEDVFVRPQFRGRGLGTALFRRMARIAVDRGCARMEWAVLDWNEPALNFYRKIGAVPMSDWTVHRLADDGLLRLASAP